MGGGMFLVRAQIPSLVLLAWPRKAETPSLEWPPMHAWQMMEARQGSWCWASSSRESSWGLWCSSWASLSSQFSLGISCTVSPLPS